MPRSLAFELTLVATHLAVCQGISLPAVTSGVRHMKRQTNITFLRTANGTFFDNWQTNISSRSANRTSFDNWQTNITVMQMVYQTSTYEPISDKVRVEDFLSLMIVWILVVATVLCCNAQIGDPQLGCLSCLCCLGCPGGFFALCHPVDSTYTSFNSFVDSAENLGCGETQNNAGESEQVVLKAFLCVNTMLLMCLALYLAYIGYMGEDGGCAPLFSEVLMCKSCLMLGIIAIQVLSYVMLPDSQTGNMFMMTPPCKELPSSEHGRVQLIILMMRLQKAFFYISVGVTFCMWLAVPKYDPGGGNCRNGKAQLDAAFYSLVGWPVLPLLSLGCRCLGTAGLSTFAEQRDAFVKFGHLLLL